MHLPGYRVAIVAVATLALCAASPLPALAQTDGPFPEYEAIRGNVDFWKQVWGTWSQGQVAVHDMDYPGVVYEVIDLPGEIEPRYTDAQLDFLEGVREGWTARLEAMEARVSAGRKLDKADRKVALLLTTAAGSDALTGAGNRVRTQRGLRERFKRGLEISYRYDYVFRAIFRDRGLPEDLAYLPHVESSFQWAAKSTAGAVGIWQFTRGTGRSYMYVTSALDERLDPIAAARGAAVYLADAYEKLPNWPIALTSYNHGVAGMARAVERFGVDYPRIYLEYDGRTFGFASRNFYAEFLAAREIARNPDSYFPEGFDPEPPFDHDSVILDFRTTPARIASTYELPLEELAAINPGWSDSAVRHGLVLPDDVQVWLPTGTVARFSTNGALTMPPEVTGERTYAVRRGDTLSRIASRHGMRIGELRSMNGLSADDHVIRVGQKLQVSGGFGGETIYRVRPGDTLSNIARDHGMRVGELRELNEIPRGSSLIRPGQTLVVAGGIAVHVVRSGETLGRIASTYGVRLGDLLQANALSLQSLIRPGQTIRIPATR